MITGSPRANSYHQAKVLHPLFALGTIIMYTIKVFFLKPMTCILFLTLLFAECGPVQLS